MRPVIRAIPYDNGDATPVQARMAKSADAADLKFAGRKAVGVQIPLRAPIKSIGCECSSFGR
jgi:hypothetical protein